MSKRTVPEIQQQYKNLCLKAGHLQYQVYTLGKDLEFVNKELRDLNLEAASLKADEDKAAAEAAKSANTSTGGNTADNVVPINAAPQEVPVTA